MEGINKFWQLCHIRKGRKLVNIKELLDICIDKNLIDMTISSRKLKDETKAQKVKIRLTGYLRKGKNQSGYQRKSAGIYKRT